MKSLQLIQHDAVRDLTETNRRDHNSRVLLAVFACSLLDETQTVMVTVITSLVAAVC